MDQAHELLDSLDNDEVMGGQYEDLVFICSIHEIFYENVFSTPKTLVDLYDFFKLNKKLSKKP